MVDQTTRDYRHLQRYTKLVPYEFTHLVCTCTTEEKQEAHKSGRRTGDQIEVFKAEDIRRCNNCGKYPRHLLRRCSMCDEIFVKAFRHRSECVADQRCWNCSCDVPASVKLCEQGPPRKDGHSLCYRGPNIEPNTNDLVKREPVTAEDISNLDWSLDF